METDNKEQAFPCKVCGSAFSDSSRLKKHMQTHRGKKKHFFVKSVDQDFLGVAV